MQTLEIRKLVEEEEQIPIELKTKRMFQLEYQFNQPIQVLLAPTKPSKEIAKELGIAESTLSWMRKRIGMEDVRILPPGPKRRL